MYGTQLNMEQKIYTTFAVAKVINIKYGRLREWLDRGYIEPFQKADGQGSKALFSRWDLYILQLFIHVQGLGFSRDEAALRVKSIQNSKKTLEKTGRKFSPDWIAFDKTEGAVSYARFFSQAELETKPIIDLFKVKKMDDMENILFVNFKKIKSFVDSARG